MNKKIRFVVIGLAVLGIQSTAWAKVKEKDLCKNPNYSHLIDSVGSQIGNMSACCTTAKLEIGTVCTPIQIIDKKKAKPNKKKNKEICLAPGFPNYFSSVSSPWGTSPIEACCSTAAMEAGTTCVTLDFGNAPDCSKLGPNTYWNGIQCVAYNGSSQYSGQYPTAYGAEPAAGAQNCAQYGAGFYWNGYQCVP